MMADLQSSHATARASISKFLVVCSTRDKIDDWFFGNFVGFYRALSTLGITGDFWSAFPLEEYFADGWTDIKFGRDESWNPLEVYTEQEHDRGSQFWTQYGPSRHDRMANDLFEYIDDASGKGLRLQRSLRDTVYQYQTIPILWLLEINSAHAFGTYIYIIFFGQ